MGGSLGLWLVPALPRVAGLSERLHPPAVAQFRPPATVTGGKNYLGHDKHWAENLIIFPDHWAGVS